MDQSPSATNAPVAWQYRIVRMAERAFVNLDNGDLQDALDAEGRDGWQLATIVRVERPRDPGGMHAFGAETSTVLIFRRAVPVRPGGTSAG
jgi:hypothetical protein